MASSSNGDYTRRQFLEGGVIAFCGISLGGSLFALAGPDDQEGPAYRIFFKRKDGRWRFSGDDAAEIWVMGDSGGCEDRLTCNDFEEVDAAVSPDGKFLAFSELRYDERPGHYGIASSTIDIMDIGSGKEVKIPYRGNIGRSDIAWSADSEKLAFVDGFGGYTLIRVKGRDGEPIATYSADNGVDVNPTFSPDGERVAFGCNGGIFVGSGRYDVHRIAGEKYPFGNSFCPVWSPRGDKIIFASNRENEFEYKMYVMNPDGREQEPLVPEHPLIGFHRRFPHPGVWSPDGSKVAFKAKLGEEVSVHVVSVDGRKVERVTRGLRVDPYSCPVHWSPDGKTIAFEAWDFREDEPTNKTISNLNIYSIEPGKSKPNRLTKGPMNDILVGYR